MKNQFSFIINAMGNMDWFILSLLTGLSVASQDAWMKKFFSDFNSYEMSVIPMLFSLPLFIPALFFIDVPVLDMTFAVWFILSLPLNALSIILYMSAIRRSPLSLTLPYLAFSPVFMIFTGYFFLGEIPDNAGVSGVIIICIGAYILNLDEGLKRFFVPFKSLTKERGSLIMIFVAFLFSVAAPVGKIAILHSSPEFFSISFFIVLTIFMSFCFYSKISFRRISKKPLMGFGAGILFACHVLFHSFAVALTNVTYMISIKRFSVIFGIIYGRLFFNETNTFFRLIGALVMLCGAALITLS